MTTQLLIENSSRQTFDYNNMAKSVEYITNRTGSPGKLKISLIKNENAMLNFAVGNATAFFVDGIEVFRGYIFSISQSRFGDVDIIAYDQLRYLKAEASYLFVGMEAGDIIKRIATDFSLDVGEIENTGYEIPYLYKEEKSCLDIIYYALQLTTCNTGKIYIFYDKCGKLCLQEAEHMMRMEMFGNMSLLTDYKYKIDIDKETYNQIKLVRPNKSTGKADTYIAKSSDTIERWGLLQYYEKVDENLNAAQIAEQAKVMLEYYNRALKSLSIDALGVVGIRAGSMVLIHISDVPDVSTSQYVLLEKVTHTFKNNDHTMSFDTRSLN